MLQNSLDAAQSLYHVCAVVVEVPQLPIVALVRPPEGILFEHLILLEFSTDTPAFVISQRVSVLLEQSVDAGNASVPAVLQILEGQTPEIREYYGDFNNSCKGALFWSKGNNGCF